MTLVISDCSNLDPLVISKGNVPRIPFTLPHLLMRLSIMIVQDINTRCSYTDSLVYPQPSAAGPSMADYFRVAENGLRVLRNYPETSLITMKRSKGPQLQADIASNYRRCATTVFKRHNRWRKIPGAKNNENDWWSTRRNTTIEHEAFGCQSEVVPHNSWLYTSNEGHEELSSSKLKTPIQVSIARPTRYPYSQVYKF